MWIQRAKQTVTEFLRDTTYYKHPRPFKVLPNTLNQAYAAGNPALEAKAGEPHILLMKGGEYGDLRKHGNCPERTCILWIPGVVWPRLADVRTSLWSPLLAF